MSFDHRAAAGVENAELASLLEDHWAATLDCWPVYASSLGDRAYDDRLSGTTPRDHDAWRSAQRGFLERSRNLADSDRMTLRLFVEMLESDLAVEEFQPEEWMLLPRHNPVTTFGWLPEIRPIESREDVDAILARYRGADIYVAGEIETLRAGLAGGRVANAESIRRTAEMARKLLVEPTAEWPEVARLPEDHRGDAEAVVEAVLRPAFAGYASFLETELLPAGREGDQVGIHALPDGEAEYAALIRKHTSLDLPAGEIHETGLEELGRIHEEFAMLGERVFGLSDRAEIFKRLRTDPDLYFETAEEVEEKATAALAAARDAIPNWFGTLPEADCVVVCIPDHEAPYTTVAYYRPPAADGSRPGEYRINVHAPTTRPRHEAEVLAFHESIPGHHLQIAIAQELPDMPAFRRTGGITSYVEGWALYTERLADEMGLYSGDTDRLGMLSFDAWRAARLVVDTGIHAFGWTAERAVSFMLENTPLAENNVVNEVDRYVSWPGQALSYKIGQIEMWRMRREAEARLGDAFDIKAFHDVVLGAGPVPPKLLAEEVSRRW